MQTTLRHICVLCAVGVSTGIFADSITHGGTTVNMAFVDIVILFGEIIMGWQGKSQQTIF